MPDSSNSSKYITLGYQYLINHILPLLLIPTMLSILIEAIRLGPNEILNLWNTLHVEPLQILCISLLLLYICTVYFMSKPRPIYLVDYACYKPPVVCRVPFATFMEHSRINFSEPKSVDFQMKILERSGLGEETCLPPAIYYLPPKPTMEASREEAKLVIFTAMDSMLKKTGLKPKDIDILIVHCSLFSPTPSLSAMVINKYKLRSNIKSFNLAGMGCSAGVIAIDLARDLLQVHPNSNCVVVSTEIITPNYYIGNQRSMLVSNCLFRMGAAAIMLTNRMSDRRRAKYRLVHTVRTHQGGANDNAYRCVYQEEDSEGRVGLTLSKDLMEIAGEALKTNITALGPLVLPASEQLRFLITLFARKVFNLEWKPYVPDFKQAFEHYCIHAGGRAVIDELQKNLGLKAEHVEASRMTLHRFGNTSSSSLWYELSYTEAKGRMKKGDRVWQIALGSGFKCNSAVWKCNRSIKTPTDGPWFDCIDRYPVHIPEVVKH